MFGAKFFKPINVSIYPGSLEAGYWKVLVDHGVSTPEEAVNLGRRMFKGTAESLLVKQGIKFTILRADSEGSIFYDDNHNRFFSELDIREQIIEVVQKTDHGSFTPVVYVQSSDEGFNIGLITADSLRKANGEGYDKELLKIATLPYAALGLHEWSNTNIKENKIQKVISSFGWKEKDTEPTWYEQPLTLEHKYFSATIWVS